MENLEKGEITRPKAFIVGIGLLSSAGHGAPSAIDVMKRGERCLGEVSVFHVHDEARRPVGEVPAIPVDELPRTHLLALGAAREALAAREGLVPDAIVLGATTGGIPTSEELLRKGVTDLERYAHHGTGTVAEQLARALGCVGPTLTVSTACSSGSVALLVALELIRQQRAETVLAGGVDALCRLTYHGFNMLKLIDPNMTAPFDVKRHGMTVGEGAAMLLLESASLPPEDAIAELRGGALSCDAYHPSAPHPEGRGAYDVMVAALADAGVSKKEVDYINLHGTGTIDNDAAEAKAVVRLLGRELPEHSSIKGIFGHAVGAAGAFGAASTALAIKGGFVPANIGCTRPDPELGLRPTLEPKDADLSVALINSFGFGGNNAALVLSQLGASGSASVSVGEGGRFFEVLNESCLTGAGKIEPSLQALSTGERLVGLLSDAEVIEGLPKRKLRRLKRLTRLALSLAESVVESDGTALPIDSVFCGTCWGALSEFHDFMVRLYDSEELFSSPTDFVGSVHNAMAGQIALRHDARGANVTTTGGDASFEEALFIASLMFPRSSSSNFLVMGVDQHHEVLIPRLYASFDASAPTDGGGALLLGPVVEQSSGPLLRSAYLGPYGGGVEPLIDSIGGEVAMNDRYEACWFGVPTAESELGEAQLRTFLEKTGFRGVSWDYRAVLGQHATVSATATALAARKVRSRAFDFDGAESTKGKGILVLGLGQRLSCTEIRAPYR